MVQKLHFIACTGAIILGCTASAQTENAVPAKTPAPAAHHFSTARSIVSCGPDTIVYPYLKELAFAAPNDSFFIDAMVGSVRTASQAYHIDDNVNILGIQFWGGAYSTSTGPQTLPVKAYLYAVDAANMPTTILDSALVTVTQQYDFYEAMFTTPYTYNQNFAVAVRSAINDTLAVITNNAGNVWTPNYGEGLAWRRFGSGTWNSSASFFGQDLEYMIFPIVDYSVSANFTMANDTACMGDPLIFGNTSSSLYGNRFLNLHAFDAYWGFTAADSSFKWNYGETAGWSSSMNGQYTYTTSGPFDVTLAGEMLGYYTTCTDTERMSIMVMPQVNSSFTYDNSMEPTIAFTDASVGATSWMWDFGDANTSTAANPSHTYTVAGTYTVTLIASGFCGADTSTQTITITTTGIADHSNEATMFFDNAAMSLHVNLSSSTSAIVEVYGVSGNLIRSEKVNAAQSVISMGDLAAGTYLVRVISGNSISANRFAVVK